MRSPLIALLLLLTASCAPSHAEPAYLGIKTMALQSAIHQGKRFDVPVDAGLVITFVQLDSPAFDAGLAENDILLSVSDQPVRGPEELASVLASLEGETPVCVVYFDRELKRRKRATPSPGLGDYENVVRYKRKSVRISEPRKKEYARKLEASDGDRHIHAYIARAVNAYLTELRQLYARLEKAKPSERNGIEREIRKHTRTGPLPVNFDGDYRLTKNAIGYIDTATAEVLQVQPEGAVVRLRLRSMAYSWHDHHVLIEGIDTSALTPYAPLPDLPMMVVSGEREIEIAPSRQKRCPTLTPYELEPVRDKFPESTLAPT